MSIKATVTPQGNNIKSRVNPQKSISVTEYRVDASAIRLGDLVDVDTSAVSDGAVLVYSGNSVSFEATTQIQNPNTKVNGGHY